MIWDQMSGRDKKDYVNDLKLAEAGGLKEPNKEARKER